MPVAVHGTEQKVVRNRAPTACVPLPGKGAGRHQGRLRGAARIHHGLLFPYLAIFQEATAAKCELSRSASREGIPWLAELEGGGNVIAEAGKGRKGLRAVLFCFVFCFNAQL